MKDPALGAADPLPLIAVGAASVGDDGEIETARAGIGGAPAWQRDALAVSARVRALIATLRPIVVRALAFWDHAVRSVRIGGRTLDVDPSGSYRLR